MAGVRINHLERVLVAVTLWLTLGLGIWFGIIVLNPSKKLELYQQAVAAYEAQRYSLADELSEQSLALAPEAPAYLLFRAKVLARINQDQEATELFRTVTRMNAHYATLAKLELAQHYFAQTNFPAAERYYRQYLEERPNDLQANKDLGFLLQFQGRTWEAIPYAMKRIELGQFNAQELIMVGLAESHWIEDRNISHLCETRYPDHLINRVAEVKRASLANQLHQQVELLTKIIETSPHQIAPQTLMGFHFFHDQDWEGFERWHEALPEGADESPDTWYLRGLWEKEQRQPERAILCFLNSLSISLSHGKSMFQLSQVVSETHTGGLPAELIAAVKASSDISYLIASMTDEVDPGKIRKLTSALETLGRSTEAAAWCDLVCRFTPDSTWAVAEKLRYRKMMLSSNATAEERFVSSMLAELELSPSSTPFQLSPTNQSDVKYPTLDTPASNIRFRDDASSAGIDFQYFNGTTKEVGLEHILQATGGAAIVLDYDQDHWPDLYFCQSGEWPVEELQNPYSDRLYRNLGNGRFEDVTEQAGLGDRLYSQGATSGDIDNDGDPDLIVTNVGRNRFYTNNGDGTFSEQTDAFPPSFEANAWSTSAAFTDLNSDGNLDLYVVGYVNLQQALTLDCQTEDRYRSCNPTQFDAEQDRVYLNNGSGSWTDITQSSGFETADGKGLGVIAADFDRNGEIEIFVGNDTVANFFFARDSQQTKSTQPRYRNQGVFSGTALNEQGAAQASMGIGAGDVNRDGLLDLFITNFYRDSNTLYIQTTPQSFRERTRQFSLRDSGFYQLGFGTQFLDADLDGDLDLIVSNGHIDRTFATGEPDLMPPQFLENCAGRFIEKSAEELGDYFSGKYLGRAVSILDWNRDGLPDTVVSHLDRPVTLLTNQSEPKSRSISLRLVGTSSNRDAIGATVCIQQGTETSYLFQNGGDGYLSQNEACLRCNSPVNHQESTITIRWPSGQTQQLTGHFGGQEILIQEANSSQFNILHHW